MAFTYGEQTVHAVLDKDSRGNYVQVSTIESDNARGSSWAMDIRMMYTNADGEIKPTTKGVRANDELIVDLLVECVKALPEDLYEELMERVADENTED